MFRSRDKTAGMASTQKSCRMSIPSRRLILSMTKVNMIPATTHPTASQIYSATISVIINYRGFGGKAYSFPQSLLGLLRVALF